MIFTDPFARSFWDTFDEMEEMMNDMSRLFDQTRRGVPFAMLSGGPPMNVWTKDDSAMVTCELPGIDLDSVSISVSGDTLTLSGKQVEKADKNLRWIRRESPTSLEFTRTLQLPFRCESDDTEARYKKGILYIALRRPESEKPKKITVKAA